jgi:thiol-disulfide isomerase/thioredoxin
MGGVAAAAGAAGVGGAWWQAHRQAPADFDAVWMQSFQRPEGGGLFMANERGAPLLLNFWATWCPPCVTELPLLDRFHNEQRALRWQVVGLAVDQLAPVKDFLRQRPVGFPVGMAGMEGVELSRRLGNSAGALPFSIAFDSEGVPVQRKLGVLTEPDLLGWVASVR